LNSPDCGIFFNRNRHRTGLRQAIADMQLNCSGHRTRDNGMTLPDDLPGLGYDVTASGHLPGEAVQLRHALTRASP
jgi:hypothetical protein